MEDGRRSVGLIADGIEAGAPEEVRLYAHRLKGSAMHVAAGRLGDWAGRLECAGQDEDMDAAAGLFDHVREEFEKAASFLSQPDWIGKAKQWDEDKQTKSSVNKGN